LKAKHTVLKKAVKKVMTHHLLCGFSITHLSLHIGTDRKRITTRERQGKREGTEKGK
jgi:hypothetical protein